MEVEPAFYRHALVLDMAAGPDGKRMYMRWFFEEHGKVRSTTRVVVQQDRVVGFNMLGRRWDHSVLIRWIQEQRSLDWVLAHLNDAAFDTELVPPLRISGA